MMVWRCRAPSQRSWSRAPAASSERPTLGRVPRLVPCPLVDIARHRAADRPRVGATVGAATARVERQRLEIRPQRQTQDGSYGRLAAAKSTHDPANTVRVNQNMAPAAAQRTSAACSVSACAANARRPVPHLRHLMMLETPLIAAESGALGVTAGTITGTLELAEDKA